MQARAKTCSDCTAAARALVEMTTPRVTAKSQFVIPREYLQSMDEEKMADQVLRINGVDICAETFGDSDDPAVLLNGGGTHSMLWWNAQFCRRLSDAGHFVIRYDQRDTGRSQTYPPNEPGYALTDMVNDAIGLLDHLGVSVADWVGFSIGGGIAQQAALDHPDRVHSLTLISTSPGGPGAGDDDLPSPPEDFMADAQQLGAPADDSREAMIEFQVKFGRICASQVLPFNAEREREYVGKVYDRAINLASIVNHQTVAFVRWQRERLCELDVPTTVIHGDADRVLPYPHGQALAREIPGARLVTLENNGHEIPPRVWDPIVAAILDNAQKRG